MREISVFSSSGVGSPITKENDPERQMKRVIRAARKAFKTNGAWPPGTWGFNDSTHWLFGVKEMEALASEIDKLEKLLH